MILNNNPADIILMRSCCVLVKEKELLEERASGSTHRSSTCYGTWWDGGGVRPGDTPRCPESPSRHQSTIGICGLPPTKSQSGTSSTKIWMQPLKQQPRVMRTRGFRQWAPVSIASERFSFKEQLATKATAGPNPNRREVKTENTQEPVQKGKWGREGSPGRTSRHGKGKAYHPLACWMAQEEGQGESPQVQCLYCKSIWICKEAAGAEAQWSPVMLWEDQLPH